VAPGVAHGWLADKSRTTYFLDVRTDEEVGANGLPASGARRAASSSRRRINGGSEGARLVLVDEELVRAPVVAGWLRRSGTKHTCWRRHRAAGAYSWRRRGPPSLQPPSLDPLRPITPASWRRRSKAETVQVIDLRASMAFRNGHSPQARWSDPPAFAAAVAPKTAIVLIADEPPVARSRRSISPRPVTRISACSRAGRAPGARPPPVVATPELPADPDCIDFLFFTHGRHDGNPEPAAISRLGNRPRGQSTRRARRVRVAAARVG